MGELQAGFTWDGTLDETDIRAIYAACHSLRFSGWLELKDATHEAKVSFIGGDPVEISGGDTQRISMWNKGTFRAIQKIPDFEGELTDALEVSGTLAMTKPSALWAWISQYRLSCEINLERPGSKARVRFQNGHAESAEVNGAPELAALARVSSWTDGSFRVKLRPLFEDGVVVAVPPMPDSAPSDVLHVGAKQFDFSRAVQLDPQPKTPWPGEKDSGRIEATAPTKTPPRPLPAHTSTSETPVLRTRSTWPWLLAAALVGAAGGAVALYQYHLPPFSPPPKPIVEPPPDKDKTPKPTLPVAESPAPSPSAASPVPSVVAVVKEKVPPHEVKETAPPHETADDKRDKEVEKLVQKGRLLLVSGHSHSAADIFRHAEKLKPKDASLRVYEQQAMGKLGHAELQVEGKGSITIDGKKFPAPKKLKLTAGPHLIDAGDGESEITLKRGEKKKLRVKK
jgi:Domain of unknown function (DUF4388)